jgi:hypothetical protein
MCRAPWCGQPRLQVLPQGDRTPHYGCSAVTTQAADAPLPKLTGQYGAGELVDRYAAAVPGQDSQPPARIALRGDPAMDDVFVEGVSMFRAHSSTGAAKGSPATCPVPG